MDLITLLLLAVGLCFDSFAVSLSCGMSCCECRRRRMVRFAAILGVAQGVMPLIGWALAVNFHHIIKTYDHWIAFGLLAFLGFKMIKESFAGTGSVHDNPFAWSRNIVLGIATSIDALVAGVALALLPLSMLPAGGQLCNMLFASFIIAVITMSASLTGLYLGRRSRGRLGQHAELIGGCILILIGTKVLFEHLLS